MWSSDAGARDHPVRRLQRRGRRSAALVVGGTALSLPADDDRRLTDSRWHHIAVTYANGTVTAYLDGAPFATADADLRHERPPATSLAARIPAGATVVYDELAVYAARARRADDQGPLRRLRQRPPEGADATSTVSRGGRAIALYWDPPTGGAPDGPGVHRPLRARGHARAASCARPTRPAATATGLNAHRSPGGPVHASRVRAINGFGEGEAASLDTDMTETETTYVGAVTDDHPALYWRLGEYDGTLVADSSGHGHRAQYTSASTARYRNGALARHDADGAKTDGRAWYDGAYDLIRAPLATGLPTGDRTVEAWVLVEQRRRADHQLRRLQRRGQRARPDRRRHDAHAAARRPPPPDRQPLAPHRGHLRRRHGHRLPRRQAVRPRRPKTFDTVDHRRAARRPHPGRRDRRLRRARGLPDARSAPSASQAHFDASYNTLPAAPQGLQADSSEPNEAYASSTTAPAACCSAPCGPER